MTLKFVIEFSPLNINVNVSPPNQDAIVAQLEALKARLDTKENELKAALEQAQK